MIGNYFLSDLKYELKMNSILITLALKFNVNFKALNF